MIAFPSDRPRRLRHRRLWHLRAQRGEQQTQGVVLLPGLGNSAADYNALAASLKERGLIVETAEVSRLDWARNAAGLTDVNWWRGTLSPRPTVDWYLKRVHASVEAVKQGCGGGPVTLVAHSAGGWLARVYLLGYGTAGITRLVTLGAPHLPPPAESRFVDQTRGILTYVSQACPGCHHAELAYITVAGKWIQGSGLLQRGASVLQRVAGASYQQVCGRADVWGDFITPVESAHLEGATQLTLPGVFHTPIGAVSPTTGQVIKLPRPWYGSPGVLERWIDVAIPDAPRSGPVDAPAQGAQLSV
ncbi:hypothetical protein WJX81_002605 [Elliptochloris bilobata]|uniref:GPI inositol-deacylase n=1 Tax=Elliptochloris bilobata TaxID=381761 RepID=A0AAW1R0N3_9CHLO